MPVEAKESSSLLIGSSDFNEKIKASDIGSVAMTNGENISCDNDGIWTANYIFNARMQEGLGVARSAQHHPYLSHLIKTNWGVQRLDADMGRFTIVFKGVEEDACYIRYSTNSSAQAQPIETHPFFDEGEDIPDDATSVKDNEDAYGYRFGDPVEGVAGGQGSRQAIYDVMNGNRVFKGFPLNSQFDLQGVTQYLDIGISLRANIITHASDGYLTKLDSTNAIDGGAAFFVGQICDPPKEIQPDLELLPSENEESDWSWLVTKCDTEFMGSAMKQTVEFTLSGYLGWNRLIYNLEKDAIDVTDKRYGDALPKN